MASPGRTPLEPGCKIQGYEIRRRIGQGGFGIVYEAWHPVLSRRAAIKEYFPQNMDSGRDATLGIVVDQRDRQLFDRFLDKFRETTGLLSELDHPSIVKVHGYEEAHGTAYMIMDFIKGRTLDDWRQAEKVTGAKLRKVMKPVLEALSYLHSKRLYHRDISPFNIMLDKGDKPYIIDFGALKQDLIQEGQERGSSTFVQANPGFAPIEQIRKDSGFPVGAYTDVFSMAATIYNLVRRTRPIPVEKRFLDLAANGRDSYIAASYDAKIKLKPHEFDAIDKGMKLFPKDRFATIAGFADALGWNVDLIAESDDVTVVIDSAPIVPPAGAGIGVGATGKAEAAGRKAIDPLAAFFPLNPALAPGGNSVGFPDTLLSPGRRSALAGAALALFVVAVAAAYFFVGGTVEAEECRDKPAYERVIAAKSIDRLEGFVTLCRDVDGSYGGEAGKTLDNWRAEELDWPSVRDSGNRIKLEVYLAHYPDGLHLTEARALAALWKRDDDFWESVRNSRNVNDFERYIAGFPRGVHTDEARKRVAELRIEDEAHWARIVNTESIPSFEYYLKQFPDGLHVEEAKRKIGELKNKPPIEVLREAQLWDNLSRNQTIPNAENYLREFPNGKHSGEARAILRQLQVEQKEAQLWDNLSRNQTIPNAENYLREFPNGKHSGEARAILRQLQVEQKEAQLWDSLSRNQTIPNAENYLREFPNGKHSGEARAILRQLQVEQKEALLWENFSRNQTVLNAENYLREFPNGKHSGEARAVLGANASCDSPNANLNRLRELAESRIREYYRALDRRDLGTALQIFPSMGDTTRSTVGNFEYARITSSVDVDLLSNRSATVKLKTETRARKGKVDRYYLEILMLCSGSEYIIDEFSAAIRL